MAELFTIHKNHLNENTINARALWNFLESKRHYADWIKDRLKDFEENIDFVHISQINETRTGATKLTEYYITQSTAEHISLIERNEKGKEVRNFFRAKRDEADRMQKSITTLSKKEILQMALESELEKERLQIENKQKETIIENHELTLKTISSQSETYSLRDVAKRLVVQEKTLKEVLKKIRWLMFLDKRSTPSSYASTNGFAVEKQILVKNQNRYFASFRITQKGLECLLKKRNELFSF